MREANDQRIWLERLKRLKHHKENPSSGGNYEGEQYEGAQAHRGAYGVIWTPFILSPNQCMARNSRKWCFLKFPHPVHVLHMTSILLRCKRQVTKFVHKKGVSQEYLPTSIGCFTSILTTVREGMWWAKIEMLD